MTEIVTRKIKGEWRIIKELDYYDENDKFVIKLIIDKIEQKVYIEDIYNRKRLLRAKKCVIVNQENGEELMSICTYKYCTIVNARSFHFPHLQSEFDRLRYLNMELNPLETFNEDGECDL